MSETFSTPSTHAASGNSATPLDLNERRFGGVIRLYGDAGFARIRAAQVVVVGIGGVGSWAAEALARSGVGHLTLVDLDVIAESNLNRQAHATLPNLGRNKIDAMRERILSFAEDCRVDVVDDFVTPDNVAQLIPAGASLVIDAIDQVSAKAALVAHCHSHKMPVIVCGGAGGKHNAALLTTNDLVLTTQDALLSKLRTVLRKAYGFPKAGKAGARVERFKVIAIHSTEPPAAAPIGGGSGLACAGYGSVMHMTASMGLLAAGCALDALATKP